MATETLTPEQVVKDYEFIFKDLPDTLKDEITAGIVENAKQTLHPSLDITNTDEANMRDSLQSVLDLNYVMNHTDSVYKSGMEDMEIVYSVKLSNGSMVYLKRTNYQDVNHLVVRFYSSGESDVDRAVVEMFYDVEKKKPVYTTTVQKFSN